MHRIRLLAPLTVAALTLAACGGDDDTAAPTTTAAVSTTGAPTTVAATTAPATTTPPATTAAATTTTAAPATAPESPGPYAVGLRTISVEDPTRSRTLTVDVWYPVAPGTQGAKGSYTFVPGISLTSELALADAAVSDEGPFPLVVYSHGSGGLRYLAANSTEHLASHGFVVAAPDHTGNTAADQVLGTSATLEQIQYDRPLDVQRVIDALLARSATAGDPFAGAVDAEHIAVTGHSAGGYTALAAVAGRATPLGTVPPDPRVDAVVMHAPATMFLTDAELAAVNVPVLMLGGTSDTTTPIDPNITRPFALVSGRDLYRVDLLDAGHQSFIEVCRVRDEVTAIPNVPQVLVDAVTGPAAEGCAPELMPIDRAHQIINRYETAFLLQELDGADGFEEVLTSGQPDAEVQVKQ